MPATRIGFIGAGVMGGPMIANLVAAGFSVSGLARSENSRSRLVGAGAIEAGTVAELVANSDVVISMLPDTPDVSALLLEAGLAAALTPAQLYIDMSTIRPDVAAQFAAQLESSGVAMLDAPVSGGEAGAIEGTLSIMVGGTADALDRARPALEAVGTTIVHVGPSGAGQATKAANQLIVAANIQAVAEAILLLESSGVELEPALDAIGGGLAGSAVLARKRAAFLGGGYAPGFRISLHDKDLGIVQSTARENGLSLPLTAIVSQLVAALKARGDGDLDHSALLKLARELNNR